MNKKILFWVLGIVVFLVVVMFVLRTYTKSHSPQEIVKIEKKDGFAIELTYSRPYKKGRNVFGGLEPYGKVWRTGANEATEITFATDVVFAGQPVKKGKYALFTIPEKDNWTVILNTKLGQWGAFQYDQEDDLLRVVVKNETLSNPVEQHTIQFKETAEGADFILEWDQTRITFPITKAG